MIHNDFGNNEMHKKSKSGFSLLNFNRNSKMHASESKHQVVNNDYIENRVSNFVDDSLSYIDQTKPLTQDNYNLDINGHSLSPSLNDVKIPFQQNEINLMITNASSDDSSKNEYEPPYQLYSPTPSSSILLPIDDNEFALLLSPGCNQEYSYQILQNDTKSENDKFFKNSDSLNFSRNIRTSSLRVPPLEPYSNGITTEEIISRNLHRRSFSGKFNLEIQNNRPRSRENSRMSSRSLSPLPTIGSSEYDNLKRSDSPSRDRTSSIFEGNGLFIKKEHPIFRQQFSRKVFVGGLPRDITIAQFSFFGPLFVDWPNRENEIVPPNGFAFLHFENFEGVERLFDTVSNGKVRSKYTVSSQTIKSKEVEVKFWRMSDCEYIAADRSSINCSKTVFVGALPRITTASELANFMDRMFSGVVYVTIDVDLIYGYPKGAGRVTFRNKSSYNRALESHYIDMDLGQNGKRKRIEIKPFMMTENKCDLCLSLRNNQSLLKYCSRCSCSVCENCEISSCVSGVSHYFTSRQVDHDYSFDV